MRRLLPCTAVTLLATAVLAGPAFAQAPANDSRAAATAVPSLPASLAGTTVEATREPGEPTGDCACADGSVWYRYVAPTAGRIAAELTAAGDLDAVLDAYRLDRSQLVAITEEQTDDKGKASAAIAVEAGQTILIRVAQRLLSAPGTFTLTLGSAPATLGPPGSPLPGGGVTSTLDRVLRPVDVWSYTMLAGVTYRINLVPGDPPQAARPVDPNDPEAGDTAPLATPCLVRLALYGPDPKDFSSTPPVLDGRCDSYRLFTPGRRGTGRYSFRLFVPLFSRGGQRYHLQVAPAGPNDTAPGLFLANHQHVRAAISGTGVNRVDLYRFAVRSPSMLKLAVGGPVVRGLRLGLRNDRGSAIQSASGGEQLRRRLRPGRYYVSVTADAGVSGRYVLERASRIITSTRTAISGVARAHGALGRPLTLAVAVRPGIGGPVRVTLERLDPEFGWQYLRTESLTARGGRASVGFRAPTVGRFRARAEYLGTRDAAPSASGYASVLVTTRGG